MTTFLHPDLHLHSTASDGSDTPLVLLQKVRAAGLDAFALTDHDTYLGCLEIREALREGDPLFLSGIELSCEDRDGRYHILGYCCDANKPSIRRAADIAHSARREKALNRLRYLEEKRGYSFTAEEKQTLLDNENPGKPHFAELLLKKGYVADRAAGIALMDGYKGSERKLTPEEAIDAILEADGIPVLAHGLYGSGSELLSEEELVGRVRRLKASGLMGLEAYYSKYTEADTALMLKTADRFNLPVTAGSDYHGTNKKVPLGDAGNPDPLRLARFFRAAERLLNARV